MSQEQQYRKIAHRVTAWEFENQRMSAFPEWVSSAAENFKELNTGRPDPRVVEFDLKGDTGLRTVKDGDWVLKAELDGKVYLCTPDIFAQIYEPATE